MLKMKWDIFYTIIVATWLTAQVTFTECLDINKTMYCDGSTSCLIPCLQFKNISTVIWEKIVKDSDSNVIVDEILQYFNYHNATTYGTNYKNKKEQYTIAKDSKGKNSMLMISHVTALDAGNYRCRFRPDDGSYVVFLVLLVPPTRSKIDLDGDSFVAKVKKEVGCHVANIRPGKANTTISIKSAGNVLATSAIEDLTEFENADGTFNLSYTPIFPLKKSFNGRKLKCKIIWMNNTQHSVNVSISTNITVYFPPDAVEIEPVNPVKVGAKARITCRANSAKPVAHVGMRLDLGKTLEIHYNNSNSSDPGNNTGRRGVFNFDFIALRSYHKSDIICFAFWNGNQVAKTERIMHVYYPPGIEIGKVLPTIEGKQFDLECITTEDGNPTNITKYVWEFKANDSQEYGTLPSYIGAVNSSERVLIIQNATYKATGSYQCTVYNKGGHASNKTDVIVYYSAKAVNNSRVFYGEKDEAANITFYFKLLPHDDINVIWIFKNGTQEIEVNSDKISVNPINGELHKTVYVLDKVMFQNFGMYDIIIENKKDPVLKSAFKIELELKGKPQPPMNINIVATSPTSFNITWEVGRDGGSTQEFIIEYSRNSNKKTSKKIKANPVGSKQSYELGGLLPNTKYNIRLLSQTDYKGGSVSSSESVQAKTHADATNAAGIIGGVVGACTALAIIIAAIIVYICWKKRTTSNKPNSTKTLASGVEYAAVNKPTKKPKVPAKVEKKNSTPKDTKPLVPNKRTDNIGVEYTAINKMTKKQKTSPIPEDDSSTINNNKSLTSNKLKDKDGGDQNGDTAYENIPLLSRTNQPQLSSKKPAKQNVKPPAELMKMSPNPNNISNEPQSKQKKPKMPKTLVNYENIAANENNTGSDENVYMNVDNTLPTEQAPPKPLPRKKQNGEEPTMVYADLTFEHVKPNEGVSTPKGGEEAVEYSTVDFSNM